MNSLTLSTKVNLYKHVLIKNHLSATKSLICFKGLPKRSISPMRMRLVSQNDFYNKKNISKNYRIMTNTIKKESLQEMAINFVRQSMDVIPGGTDNDKKKLISTMLTSELEVIDNFVPVIGSFLDLPIINDMESVAISYLVDWAWKKFHNQS